MPVRERSRRSRPKVERTDDWRMRKRSDSLQASSSIRFTRPSIEYPPHLQKQLFSIVHPTRGRPGQAWQCFHMWTQLFSGHNKLEYVFSLDADDAGSYFPILRNESGGAGRDMKVVIHQNATMVEALNRGARHARGEILIYVSDDFECLPNWDVEIQKAVHGKGKNGDWVLFVYDGIQKATQTISILSRKYYDRFGYIYFPEYRSMWADPDFTETARRLKKNVNAFHLTFRHRHPSVGGRPFDGTYARQDSGEAWAWGEKIFARRKADNFGVSK